MKRGILFFVTLVVLVLLVWWLRIRTAGSETSYGTPNEKTLAEAKPVDSFGKPAIASPAKPTLQAQLREITASANQPISFFGKIIDQYGTPIAGVIVTFQIRFTKDVGPAGIGDTFAEPSVASGHDGHFALTGAKGSLLTIKSLQKNGYEPSPKAFDGTYWYWRDKDPYRPDADNPVVLRMWKRGPTAKLTEQRIRTAIPYDGTPITYDLVTGRETASGGDLRATLVRNPRQIVYGQRNYEWTLTVEAVDGGVIESNDEQMYRAPSDDYLPKITVHMPADDPKWTDMKTVRLYLKSRGGKHYGRVELKLMAGSDRKETGFSYHSFINPNGSQNLEYDPLQDVIKPSLSSEATRP